MIQFGRTRGVLELDGCLEDISEVIQCERKFLCDLIWCFDAAQSRLVMV